MDFIDKNIKRNDLLIKVAKLYYIENLSQQEIANKVFLSRSNISHILKKCVETNIVEFYINESSIIGGNVREHLLKKYNLKDIIFVSTESNRNQTLKRLGEAIFFYLRKRLHSNMLLGLTWGTSIYQVISAFKPITNASVDVIQMLGAVNAESDEIDSRKMTFSLAKLFSGNAFFPLAPYFVNSEALKDMLLLEPEIIEHYKRISRIDIALVGIGAIPQNTYNSVKVNYFSDSDINYLIKSGAVLNLCGVMFDKNGLRCAKSITDRIIGCSYEMIARIPEVIAVAVDKERIDAIKSALLTGLVSTLAIDKNTALALEK